VLKYKIKSVLGTPENLLVGGRQQRILSLQKGRKIITKITTIPPITTIPTIPPITSVLFLPSSTLYHTYIDSTYIESKIF